MPDAGPGPARSDGKPARRTVAMLLLRLRPAVTGTSLRAAFPTRTCWIRHAAPRCLARQARSRSIGVTLRDETARRRPRLDDGKVYGVELHADTIANLSRGIASGLSDRQRSGVLMLALAARARRSPSSSFDRPRWQRRLVLAALLARLCSRGRRVLPCVRHSAQHAVRRRGVRGCVRLALAPAAKGARTSAEGSS
jgi:hypothetical protein